MKLELIDYLYMTVSLLGTLVFIITTMLLRIRYTELKLNHLVLIQILSETYESPIKHIRNVYGRIPKPLWPLNIEAADVIGTQTKNIDIRPWIAVLFIQALLKVHGAILIWTLLKLEHHHVVSSIFVNISSFCCVINIILLGYSIYYVQDLVSTKRVMIKAVDHYTQVV